jgi:hypothetical protein
MLSILDNSRVFRFAAIRNQIKIDTCYYMFGNEKEEICIV